jgi:hypothetical protein
VGIGQAPEGFEVAKAEDQGLGVKKFEEDADRNCVVSERTWQLTLKGRDGLTALPTTFRFASVKVPAKEVIYQRYADADLATVDEEVSLERVYEAKSNRGVWIAVVASVAGLVAVGVPVWLLTRRKAVAAGSVLPEKLDPFTTAALLREVRDRPDLTPAQRAAIDKDLAAIEEYFFSADRNGTPAPDLRRMAERWSAFLRPTSVAVVTTRP